MKIKLLIFLWLVAFLQVSAQPAGTIDLKSNKRYLMGIVNGGEKGVYILDGDKTHDLSPDNLDLTLYDPKLQKHWSVAFNIKDLPVRINQPDVNFFLANTKDVLYLFAVDRKVKSSLTIAFDNNGKMRSLVTRDINDIKNAVITTYKDQVYLVTYNGKEKSEQSYYSMRLDPATLAFTDKIDLQLPILEHGQWNFLGIAKDRFYYYAVSTPDPGESKAGKKDTAVVIHTSLDGKNLGGSLLLSYLDGKNKYMNDYEGGSNFISFYLAPNGRIVTYGFYGTSEGGNYSLKLGIFINQFDEDGNNILHNTYDFASLQAYAPGLDKKEGGWITPYFLIDDTAHVNVFVMHLAASDWSPNVFTFDSTGKIVRGFQTAPNIYYSYFDVSGHDVVDMVSSYYYGYCPYKNGDSDLFEKINDCKSKNKTTEHAIYYYVNMNGTKALVQLLENKNVLNLFPL